MVENKNTSMLIYLLVFFLVFFIPSASAIGGFQLWYAVAVGVVLYGVFKNKLEIDYLSKSVFHFILISFILLLISLLFSGMNFGSLQDFNEFLRLIGGGGIFYLMYVGYTEKWNKKIVLFLKLFLLLQLIFCFLQGNDSVNRIMGIIWNTERIWDLRRTGSFANPNILSVFCVASYSYIFFRIKTIQKIIFGLVIFGIILFTSSKTGLIAFLIIVCVNFFLIKAKFSFKNIALFIISLLLGGYAGITLLYMYQYEYPYIAQLLMMFDNDMDISQIKSLGDRQIMWENALNQFNDFSSLQQLVGIGPGKDTDLNIIDNEFLTILVKMGIIGLLFYALTIFILLVFLFKNKKNLGAKSMIAIVVLFLLSSGSASTFIAWHLSLMFYLFLGMCLKEIKLAQLTRN
ncbi:O-antigen ligase family protein [Sinomicrobium sp. M5D2P9]